LVDEITVVDLGCSNLQSIRKIFKRVGATSVITDDPQEISKAKKIVLPGVGSFDHAAQELQQDQLLESLNYSVLKRKVPILGICLGAQLMTQSSDEGNESGIGWFDFKTVSFQINKSSPMKVPHMGWEEIQITKKSILFNDIQDGTRFYFLHSYHFSKDKLDNITASTNYGYDFPVAFEKDNIFGVQFHPEKSGGNGIKFMENFTKL
jgi:imidazole glycerol-phosphate synthase subunit HisH